MYPGQFEIVSLPSTGPDFATWMSSSLPPPTSSPPQAASASAPTRHATAIASCQILCSLTFPLLLVVQCLGRLAQHVHVVGSPGQPHLGPSAGQTLALILVGVRHQHRHRHVVREPHHDLGRGPQIERALDDPFHVRQLGVGAVLGEADLKLLGADHRVAALAGAEPVHRSVDADAGVELHLAPVAGLPHSPRHQVRHADEACDEGRRRTVVDLLGLCDLLDHAVVHDGYPVAHRERFLLIVRDVDERDPDVALYLL